jgi:glucokinase
VTANRDQPREILAIDIGGSRVKSALIGSQDDRWQLLHRFAPVAVAERSFAELQRIVVEIVAAALAQSTLDGGIGVSTTGPADAAGIVLGSGFFEGYAGASWHRILRERFGSRVPVVRVASDGRAAAWGTYLEDPQAKGRNVAHFVAGTGIGGGMVLGSQLFDGSHNFAGAFGHIKVTAAMTPACSCGGHGCVEVFAAGPAILRHAAGELGRKPGTLTIAELADAARAGSQAAQGAFRDAGHWLGRAIGSLVNIVDPDVVTIGGGIVAAADELADGSGVNWYVDAAAASAREAALPRIAERVQIHRAALVNDAALIGIAALVHEGPGHP